MYKSCKGFSATTIGITEQFALAIMFLFLNFDSSFELTSGTIKGISESFLKNFELSITIVLFAAIGAHFSATALPAAKKAIFTFEKSNFSKSSTVCSLPKKFIFFPELFDEATKKASVTEKFFFSSTSISFLPTLPVAPTIAIFMMI